MHMPLFVLVRCMLTEVDAPPCPPSPCLASIVIPQVHRFTTSVFPSEDDDVVTSPYNSVLALHQVPTHIREGVHSRRQPLANAHQ